MWVHEFEGHRKKVFDEDDVTEEGGDVSAEEKPSASAQITEGGPEKEKRQTSNSQHVIIDATINEILVMMSQTEKKLKHLKELINEGDEKKINAF